MSKPLHITIADDESEMRDYLSLLLPRLGHEVTGIASTGLELVQLCRQAPPDLIITDVRMPGLDGVEAVKQIHSERSIPVIFVSAFADVPLVAGEEKGRCVHLHKPVGRAELEEAIAKMMEQLDDRISTAQEP